MTKSRTLLLVVLPLLGLAAVLSACGGSGDKADLSVNVRAENNRFSPDRIEIPAGKKVKLTLENLDAGDHTLQVTGLKAKMSGGGDMGGMDMGNSGAMSSLMVQSRGKTSVSVTFVADQRGTYDFFCTMSGLKEAGMVGKLVVN